MIMYSRASEAFLKIWVETYNQAMKHWSDDYFKTLKARTFASFYLYLFSLW